MPPKRKAKPPLKRTLTTKASQKRIAQLIKAGYEVKVVDGVVYKRPKRIHTIKML